jgi:hypothetical protein
MKVLKKVNPDNFSAIVFENKTHMLYDKIQPAKKMNKKLFSICNILLLLNTIIMFSKFFWSKSEECFICCSVDGKSDTEKQFEMIYNQKYTNYPLLPLSKIYSCNCCTSYAHNKCLLNLNKCPTCRKVVSKPNLYVKTSYGFY